MNHQSMPILLGWPMAMTRALRMSRNTGRRWRVRQIGHVWIAHEIDQPVLLRKPQEDLNI